MKLFRRLSSALLGLAVVAGLAPAVTLAQEPNTFTVYAEGLNGPRGLRFGPDGYLYVAEAGRGGTHSTGNFCEQVGPPVGPYTGARTARISRISANGHRKTVAAGFPSAQNALGDVIGVADVAFLDGTLYALVAGGGCSHGFARTPAGVAEVNRDTGDWHIIANIGAFLKTHPAAFESPDDFEPDGSLYSLLRANGRLYAVEPNHGQILSIKKNGTIRQVIDISFSQGHIVPTSIAKRGDTFYVGNLNLFPIDPQWAQILLIAKDNNSNDDVAPGFDTHGFRVVDAKAGFTTVVAVDFGPDGLLYALELSDAPGFPALGAGKVVRVKSNGAIEEVVTGLSVPTGMTFGPDARLYISNFGAAPAGLGQILRFDIAPGS